MSSAVEQIIRPFLAKAPSKTDIDAAEKLFDDARRDQPAVLVEQLFAAMQNPNMEVGGREQASVLLRKCFQQAKLEEGSLWNRLGDAGQNVVKSKLLEVFQQETVAVVRKKVADSIQALANQLINIDEDARPNNIEVWPNLMPTLMSLIVDNSKDAGMRGDCLFIVKEMLCTMWHVMIANGVQTLQVLTMCFEDASETVSGNALALMLEMLENVNNKEERKPFAVLLPSVSKVLKRMANSSDSKPLKLVLEIFANQTEVTKFMKDILASEIMPCLSQIAQGHTDEDVRKAGMETIINLFTSYPKGTVTNQSLVAQAVEGCTQVMMTNLSDDMEEWTAQDDEEDLDTEELFRIGRDNIDRICRAATEAGNSEEDRQHVDKVLEVLKLALATLFSAGQWKSTVCGLTIFQQMSEYVDDDTTVREMLDAVQAQLKASHPRVRHMAWTCISQMSEDHIEVLSTEPCVAPLMGEFALGLDDPVERVCCRSMESFQHYGESVEREDMEPFVKALMSKIAPKLKASSQCQRKAITTIAVVAGQMADGFAEYYTDLMPFLKEMIAVTLHKVEERSLLGKCFECISLLAKAIGKDGFRQDAQTIMEAMIKATQQPNLPANDPVLEYMMAASQRICSVLKEEFLPMVPHVLPQALAKFTLEPKEFNQLESGDINEQSEVTLTMTRLPDGQIKFMFMNDSDIEDLTAALQCVHCFIEQLGGAFSPWVQETAKALMPVFDFNIEESIRDLAFETWGDLCKCSRAANQVGAVGELVMEFLKRVVPAFEKADDQYVDVEAMKTKADGITCILKQAGANILQLEQVSSLAQLPLTAMVHSYEREQAQVQAIAKMKAEGKVDDEDETRGDSSEEESMLRTSLAEIAGALMKHHPDAFVTCGLQPYLEFIAKIQQSTNKSDRKLILYIACDLLDHLGPRVVAHWDKFVPIVLEDVLCADASRRQAACYGVSLVAREAAFAPVALETAKKCEQVITQSRNRAKKKSEKQAQACADNALSGLIAIVLQHGAALGAEQEQFWNVWLQGLPCQEDEEEGIKNHRNLLKFVMEERIEVLKQGASNFPKVLAILVDQYKTPMVDEETNKGIQQLVLNLGQAKLEQFAAALSEKQKKKLLRVHREATSGK